MSINLSSNPYYDDYDPNKNYVRILFKPGYPVQSRELTQLQTMLQEQITRFGDHIFKNGSIVKGGNTSMIDVVYFQVDSFDITDDEITNDVLSALIKKDDILNWYNPFTNEKIASAKVAILDNDYIWYTPLSGEIFNEYTQDGVTLDTIIKVYDDSTNVHKGNISSINNSFDVGTKFSIVDESVFYVNGYFLYIDSTDYFYYEYQPTVTFGLDYSENIITSTEDTSLLDPAQNSFNFAAPGADRYQIQLIPNVYTYTQEGEIPENFIELLRVSNGDILKKVTQSDYNIIEDTLARRTYDEAGDFTVTPFQASIKYNYEKDDNKEIKPYYNNENYNLLIKPGKAYVKGYEFGTNGETTLTFPKARTTETDEQITSYGFGQYIYITNLNGDPQLDIHKKITFLDGGGTSPENVVGTAYPQSIDYDSTKSTYRLYLNRIKLSSYTENDILTTRSFSDTINITNFDSVLPFTADIDISAYDNTPIIKSRDNQLNTNLVRLPNEYVKTFKNETDETLIDINFIKKFDGYTLSGSASTSTVSIVNSTTNQHFFPLGEMSEVDVNNNIFAVVKTNTDTGPSAGTILTYTDGLRANVISESEITISYENATNFGTSGLNTVDFYIKVRALNQDAKQKTPKTRTFVTSNVSNYNVTLDKCDGIRLISVYSTNDTLKENNLKDSYTFYSGQKDTVYDFASIVFNGDSADKPSGGLIITYSYYEHTGKGIFTADSYAGLNTDGDRYTPYYKIPVYKSTNGEKYRLADVFDFRPLISEVQDDLIPIIGSNIEFTYEYYQGRKDLLVATKDKTFSLIQGTPGENDDYPNQPDDAMTLYKIDVKPYTMSMNDVKLKYVDNRRYTMRDIGDLDKKISNLEYYNARGLLEQKAEDVTIPDTVTGLDKFKSGIMVDSFMDFSLANGENPDFKCSIDTLTRTLRPSFSISEKYKLITNTLDNVKIVNNKVISDYVEEPLITQRLASDSIYINPINEVDWQGNLIITPSSDTWSSFNTQSIDEEFSSSAEYNNWLLHEIGVDASTFHESSSYREGDHVIKYYNGTITQELSKTYARGNDIEYIATGLKPNTKLFLNIPYTFFRGYTELVLDNDVTSDYKGVTITSGTKSADIVYAGDNRLFIKNLVRDTTTDEEFINGDVLNINGIQRTIIDINYPKSDVISNDYGVTVGTFSFSDESLYTGDIEIIISNSPDGNGFARASATYSASNITNDETEVNIRVREYDPIVIEPEPEPIVEPGDDEYFTSTDISVTTGSDSAEISLTVEPGAKASISWDSSGTFTNIDWFSSQEVKSNHTILLEGLTAETLYTFKIIVYSEDDTEYKVLPEETFTTDVVPGTAVTIVSAPAISDITTTSMVVSWETDVITNSEIDVTIGDGNSQTFTTTGLTSHTLTIDESDGTYENDPPLNISFNITILSDTDEVIEQYTLSDTLVSGTTETGEVPDDEEPEEEPFIQQNGIVHAIPYINSSDEYTDYLNISADRVSWNRADANTLHPNYVGLKNSNTFTIQYDIKIPEEYRNLDEDIQTYKFYIDNAAIHKRFLFSGDVLTTGKTTYVFRGFTADTNVQAGFDNKLKRADNAHVSRIEFSEPTGVLKNKYKLVELEFKTNELLDGDEDIQGSFIIEIEVLGATPQSLHQFTEKYYVDDLSNIHINKPFPILRPYGAILDMLNGDYTPEGETEPTPATPIEPNVSFYWSYNGETDFENFATPIYYRSNDIQQFMPSTSINYSITNMSIPHKTYDYEVVTTAGEKLIQGDIQVNLIDNNNYTGREVLNSVSTEGISELSELNKYTRSPINDALNKRIYDKRLVLYSTNITLNIYDSNDSSLVQSFTKPLYLYLDR